MKRYLRLLRRTFYPQSLTFGKFWSLNLTYRVREQVALLCQHSNRRFGSVIFCESFRDVQVCIVLRLAKNVSKRDAGGWFKNIEISKLRKQWFYSGFFYDGEKLTRQHTYNNVLFNQCDSWPRERGILRTYRYTQRRYRVDIVTRNVSQVCTCNALTLYASRVIISRCRCTWFINVSWR